MIRTLDTVVYSLIVMKIQYTEQQYNDLETEQFLQNRFSALLRRRREKQTKILCLFYFVSDNMQIFFLACLEFFPERFHRIKDLIY